MSTARKISIAAVSVAALSLIAWWFERGDHDPTAALPTRAAESEATPSPSPVEIERRAIEHADSVPVVPLPTPVAGARKLQGRLFVEGGDKPIEDLQAEIGLMATVGLHDNPRGVTVDVTAGRFELSVLPNETRAIVNYIRVDGREAQALTRDISLVGDGELRIDARIGAGVLLHVVDASSRAELGEVTIVGMPEQISFSALFDLAIRCPTPAMLEHPLIELGTSPLQLPATPRAESFWVTARGREWRRVFIAGQSGERTVALGPGCELLVNFSATQPPTGALRLSIDGAGSDAYLALQPLDPAGEPSVLIEGLPPGACSASIERVRRNVECVASKMLMLEVGERARWDVEWGAVESPPHSKLRVIVHAKLAPPGEPREAMYDLTRIDKGAVSVREKLVGISVPLSADPSSGDYVASVPQLVSGTYELAVSPWGQLRQIEIAAGIDATCEFDPSTRIACSVRVLDDTSRQPLPNARVRYANVAPGARADHMFDAKERDASGSAWRVWVEPGEVEFTFGASGYTSQRRTETVASFDQEITVSLRPSAELPIAMRLMQGDAEYPIDPEDWVKVVIDSAPPGGGATLKEFPPMGVVSVSSSMVMRVGVAGSYVLRIPPAVCGGTADQLVRVDVKDPGGASVEIQRQD